MEADVWSSRDVRGSSGECSDQLAVLLCRVLLKCGERLMFRVAAGEDPVARLGCLPNVAGVLAGSFGGATGFCYLSGGGRRLVAVVAAPLLLSLVVFLRLESGWGLRFDLTTASCPVTAAWPLCVGVWFVCLSVFGRPLSYFLQLTVTTTRDRPYIPWSGATFRR